MKKQKNGYYKKSFTVNGQSYTVYSKSLAELRIKEAEKRQEIEDKRYKKNNELTVLEYFNRWMESRVDTITQATARQNRHNSHITCEAVIDRLGGTFGSLMIKDVERQNVLDVQRWLKDAKDKDGKNRFSVRTVNSAIYFIKQVLDTAVYDDILVKNPAKGIKTLKQTEQAARDTIHRALSVEETKAFFESAESMNEYFTPLFKFLINSGCRIGEAGALKLSNISRDWIEINATITRDLDNQYVIMEQTKTAAGRRRIPLTAAAREAIEAQKANNSILFGDVISLTDTIFKSPRGSILRESKVNLAIERICKAAEIEKFTAHSFRATFATRCIESGMNPKTLQTILGHSDISMTMNLYTHVMENTKIREMQLLEIGL